jgi:hypothetical protein
MSLSLMAALMSHGFHGPPGTEQGALRPTKASVLVRRQTQEQ